MLPLRDNCEKVKVRKYHGILVRFSCTQLVTQSSNIPWEKIILKSMFSREKSILTQKGWCFFWGILRPLSTSNVWRLHDPSYLTGSLRLYSWLAVKVLLVQRRLWSVFAFFVSERCDWNLQKTKALRKWPILKKGTLHLPSTSRPPELQPFGPVFGSGYPNVETAIGWWVLCFYIFFPPW